MMSSQYPIVFNVLAGGAVLFALATVLTQHILRSAIYLMGVLCLSAGLYLLLGAEFLAGVQLLVYVGGIVVLLVFAVMLTRSEDLEQDRPSTRRRVVGFLGAGSFFWASAYLLAKTPLNQTEVLGEVSGDVSKLGHAFLDTGSTGYALPFEVISLLLLAVLVAGVVLARRELD